MAPNRLVRREPLLTRIKAHLDPLDFLLWLSEELNSNEWEIFAETWASPIGITLNALFVLARANAVGREDLGHDDVFADYDGPGWLAWVVREKWK